MAGLTLSLESAKPQESIYGAPDKRLLTAVYNQVIMFTPKFGYFYIMTSTQKSTLATVYYTRLILIIVIVSYHGNHALNYGYLSFISVHDNNNIFM